MRSVSRLNIIFFLSLIPIGITLHLSFVGINYREGLPFKARGNGIVGRGLAIGEGLLKTITPLFLWVVSLVKLGT
jgi:hypothetical protein